MVSEDEELPGPPTEAQLAELDSAVLLCAAATKKEAFLARLKRWNGRGSLPGGFWIPGMPTEEQLAQLDVVEMDRAAGIGQPQEGDRCNCANDGTHGSPTWITSREQWADLDEWFEENVGTGGVIGAEIDMEPDLFSFLDHRTASLPK
ncbi:hypothetical protein HDU81_009632 [Chytriomyces hyalinus]|nr:hypothetical protein HDU81_009632 [Chytriomyces hyalinus]